LHSAPSHSIDLAFERGAGASGETRGAAATGGDDGDAGGAPALRWPSAAQARRQLREPHRHCQRGRHPGTARGWGGEGG
jgi:hypothetical protein